MLLRSRIITITAVLVLCAPQLVWAQIPAQPRVQDQGEVVRVLTELVQTDVTVLDKNGRFVDGLKASDFELKIDGQRAPIEFFEKVTAGSINEESQLAAARGSSSRANPKSSAPVPLDRGRPVFFFLDDAHLDLSSLNLAKKLISRFIEKEMGQNDEAAIASVSGQIGFLQQLTDNKTVLRTALERLKPRPYVIRDFERPPMTEYQALLIESFDREVKDYFVDETLRANPGIQRQQAEAMVENRASTMLHQSARTTSNTLLVLEHLVKAAQTIQGRKLVFFISGGFFLDNRNADASFLLRRIASAAAKNGVVIYSIDARGLVAGMDAGSEGQFDVSGRLSRATMGELRASQDGLNSLARDTGGRAYFNTNSFEPSLRRSLNETSSYYLLAWKPEAEKSGSKFRKIEVTVIGKPDLTVNVRRGFFDVEPEPPANAGKKSKNRSAPAAAKTPVDELRKLISAPFPNQSLPISLTLSYAETPGKGLSLSTLVSIPSNLLSYVPDAGGMPVGEIDVVGRVFNDRGEAGTSFSNRLTVRAPSVESTHDDRDVGYGHSVFLSPGLYHVRVAARDSRSGRAGSAFGWIEIPDVASGQLALSSPVLARRLQTEGNQNVSTQSTEAAAELSLSRTFSTSNYLRFLVFVYNSQLSPADLKPDLAVQVHVIRDNQPVVTTPLKKISVEGVTDLRRIPYAAEVHLQGLSRGRYLLQLTVLDRVSKRSASQQTRFTIE